MQKEAKTDQSDANHYTDCIQTESGDTSPDHHKYQEWNLTRDENMYQDIQSQGNIT